MTTNKDHFKRMADKSHLLAKDRSDSFGKGAHRFVPSIVSTDDRVLTIREASALYRVNHLTIREWIRKGVLPHIRVGPPPGLIRLRESDLARVVTPEDQDVVMDKTRASGK